MSSRLFLFCILLICFRASAAASSSKRGKWPRERRLEMRQVVKEMFFHGFDNYMELAFPHDELKPVSGTFVDSLHELGNSNANQSEEYRGIGLTLIDSLSTLAVMNESALFQKLLRWIIENIPNFDLDLRVHVFEVNIRVLGGLLSAHFLASDPDLGLFEGYQGQLIPLMEDLGKRLLKSFGTKSGIPYAWVNLRHGVLPSETTETCTACVGTLLLEFGALSYLTKDFSFFDAAFQSLKVLWSLKNEKTGLLGNTLDLITGRWKNSNAGIGAGIDSFYEYLLKSFIFFGRSDLLNMFEESYKSIQQYLRSGPWYIEASMFSGNPSYLHFNSLQAFFPGLQVLYGDVEEAIATQSAFFSVWESFGALPERYLLNLRTPHPSENYYPLRPELMESTYFSYLANGDPRFLSMGKQMIENLNSFARVEHGFAGIKNVKEKTHDDKMHSFFLAETCKYLYLLFDDDNFVHNTGNWLFTTEGHLFPVMYEIQQTFQDRLLVFATKISPETGVSGNSVESKRKSCSLDGHSRSSWINELVNSDSFDQRCSADYDRRIYDGLEVFVESGAFFIISESGHTIVRNLGTSAIEIFDKHMNSSRLLLMLPNTVMSMDLEMETHGCQCSFAGAFSWFGPLEENIGFEGYFEIEEIFPTNGCFDDKSPLPDLDGKIALVNRGECSFARKVALAERSGAIGVIIVNTLEPNNLFVMGDNSPNRLVGIPSMMIEYGSGEILRACLREQRETLSSNEIWVKFSFKNVPIVETKTISGIQTDFMYQSLGDLKLRIHKEKNLYHLNFL